MPTPTRVTRVALLRAAEEIVEREGGAGLTMQAVARALDVRAPSLYKHVRDRDELVRLVAESVAIDLGEQLDAAFTASNDARAGVRAVAASARSFAAERPAGYGLLFGAGTDAAQPRREVLERASAAIVTVAGQLVGSERALDAARTLTAWMHGFIMMERAHAFRLGGDVDRAWEYGLDRLVDGLIAGRHDEL